MDAPKYDAEGLHPRLSIDARHYIPLACLVGLVLDTVSTWRVEYSVIWRQQKGLIPVIYLWARYGALAAMVAHYVISQVLLPPSMPLTIRQCSIWYSVVVAMCCSLTLSLESILTLRVYALYGKTRKIWIFLLPAGIQYGSCVFFVYFQVFKRGDVPRFDSTCGLHIKTTEGMIHVLTTLTFHGLLWGATLAQRRLAGSIPSSQVNRSIVQWVSREGTIVFGLVFLIIAGIGPAMSVSKTVKLDIVFVVPITFLSIITSRLILNMRTLNFQHHSCSNDSQELPQISTVFQSFSVTLDNLE